MRYGINSQLLTFNFQLSYYMLYFILRYIVRYRLKVVKENIARSFPEKSEKEQKPVISMKLSAKKIITGKETDILTPACTVVLNAIKELSKIPDDIKLISPNVLEPMLKMKKDLDAEQTRLGLTEVLTALSITSTTNPMVEKALSNLKKLKNFKTIYLLRLRYAEIESADSSNKINAMSNNILKGMQTSYEQKYDVSFGNLYKYINSSLDILEDVLNTELAGLRAKRTLVEKGGIK